MSHAYHRLVYHVVFSTKHREPWLAPNIRQRVHDYLGGIVHNIGGISIAVGGVADHVHLLVKLPAKLALSDVIRDLKANSSKWMHDQGIVGRQFGWQSGYAAFTVSKSGEDAVMRYIASQEHHHGQMTYEDEFRTLLEKHEVEYDERCMWD